MDPLIKKSPYRCGTCKQPKSHHDFDCTARPRTQAGQVASLFRDQIDVLAMLVDRQKRHIKGTVDWNDVDIRSAKGLSAQVAALGNLWLKIQKVEKDTLTTLTVEEKLAHMRAYVMSLPHAEKREEFVVELMRALGWERK